LRRALQNCSSKSDLASPFDNLPPADLRRPPQGDAETATAVSAHQASIGGGGCDFLVRGETPATRRMLFIYGAANGFRSHQTGKSCPQFTRRPAAPCPSTTRTPLISSGARRDRTKRAETRHRRHCRYGHARCDVPIHDCWRRRVEFRRAAGANCVRSQKSHRQKICGAPAKCAAPREPREMRFTSRLAARRRRRIARSACPESNAPGRIFPAGPRQ